jgi:SNF2 family DNA or RNA helicase
MSFQKKGIKYINDKNGTCVLADDMGLGKTIQAIGYICLHPEFENILVVCPASIKLNWKKEIEIWLNEESGLINNSIPNNRIKIINYDILKKHKKELIKLNFDLIIGDECFTYHHKIQTDKGLLKIGDIIENNINCNIISYNLSKKILEIMPIIRFIKKRVTNNLIEIKLNNGKKILTTLNHKIWSVTDGEWKIAERIEVGEELHYLQQNFHNSPLGIKKILFYFLFSKMENATGRNKKKNFYRTTNTKNSTNKKNKKIGREKNICLKSITVESIKILELGDIRKSRKNKKHDYVYNLEVKKNHNYFCNNILVSNCHYAKNKKAKRTQAFLKIAKRSKRILAISGTPITNRPAEFWNILHLVCPEIFSNWWEFVKKFCDLKIKNGELIYKGCTNPKRLNSLLVNNCMIRRLKKEVLTDLPEKIKTIIPLELTNFEEYFLLEKDFVNWLSIENKKRKQRNLLPLSGINKIEKLKQLSAIGKMKAIIEWIENFLESDNKLVIMVEHHFIIDRLYNHFKKAAVKFDGRDTINKRDEVVNVFQNDQNVKLFIGQIKAAGIGLTLTAASTMGIIQFCWTPGELDQITDRIHRIGQKNACNIYYFVGVNTIDEFIINVLDVKKKNIDLVLNGEETNDNNLLQFLLKKYLKIKNNDSNLIQ